jgi:RHS repeat-associated protein
MDTNRTQNYTYDHLSRLTQAVSTSYGTLTWQYSLIGNITYNSQMGSYTYGTKPHAVTQAGSNTYGYDANGNMINKAGVTITYDYDNRPAATGSTSFVYDSSGQRVKKITPGTTITYVGKHYECTNGVCKKYVFAGSQRVAVKTNTGTWYYHPDHLGSSSIVTDNTGNKSEEIYYYPFGGTRTDTGSVSVKHKFTGQERDDETGLYYYGARYYDPQLGRFISADSIVQAPFDPQTLNRYSYCRNNPIIYSDPSGHDFGLTAILIGAAFGALSSGVLSVWDLLALALGAVTGAISGACFYGAGEIISNMANQGAIAGVVEAQSMGLGPLGTAVLRDLGAKTAITTMGRMGIHAIAGGVSGAINTGITGGDIGMGALTGAVSGGIAKGLGSLFHSEVAGNGYAGIATMYGGDFGEGAFQGAWTAGFGYMFNNLLHPLDGNGQEVVDKRERPYGTTDKELWSAAAVMAVGPTIMITGPATVIKAGEYLISTEYVGKMLANPKQLIRLNKAISDFLVGYSPGAPQSLNGLKGWTVGRAQQAAETILNKSNE